MNLKCYGKSIMHDFNVAEYDLKLGDATPYDCKLKASMPSDWAHRAARAILVNFRARRDIGPVLETFKQDIRVEIVESISDIIRKAHESA